jgi:hypothetical protein
MLIDNYRSLRTALLQMFIDHLERLADFALQIAEVGGQRRALGIDHYIHGNSGREITQPDGLTQATSDSISLDRAAQCLAHRETNSRALQLVVRTAQVKNRHMRREVPTPLFIDSLKVRMPQQAVALRKSAWRISSDPLFDFHSCSGRETPLPQENWL